MIKNFQIFTGIRSSIFMSWVPCTLTLSSTDKKQKIQSFHRSNLTAENEYIIKGAQERQDLV